MKDILSEKTGDLYTDTIVTDTRELTSIQSREFEKPIYLETGGAFILKEVCGDISRWHVSMN